MQKIKTKIKYLVFALCMMAVGVGFGRQSVLADSIIVSVERFTLGGDFMIDPTEVEIQKNEKYSDVIPRVLKATGKYEAVGRIGGFGYYLEGINGAQCEVKIPACVQDIINSKNLKVEGNKHTSVKGLYEFDYTQGSGWMYTVNNEYAMGMSSVTAHDGDVVRVMYTLTLGADIFGNDAQGGTTSGATAYYKVADKSQLMRLMAEANDAPERWNGAGSSFTSAYQFAKTVMAKMNASDSDVQSAVAMLQDVKDSLPKAHVTGVSLDDTLTLVEGETENLKYKLKPRYATADSVEWKSDNSSVARVDADGKVTAVKAGSAKITVTVDGKYTTVTTVTVKAMPQDIRLNKTSLTLRVQGSEQLTCTLYPENSYENVIWRSSDTDVVSVTQDGVVMANDVGEIDVTVMSAADSSIQATCHVTVLPALKLVSVPKTVNYTYNGAKRTGVAAGTGYTLSGTASATNAGTYTVKATLTSGYAWSNGSIAPVTLTWRIAKAGQTISASVTTRSYKLNAVKKKAYSFTIGARAQGAVSYRISRTPAGGAKYITVDKNGKVTVKKKAPGGVYQITVTAAATANQNAATRVITINVTKNKQTISAKKKSVTYKTSALKKNKTYSIGVKAKSKITYRVTSVPTGGKGYVTVNSKGKVTVKKGAPKGTYSITLTAAENKEYAAASRVVAVRIK